MQYIQIQIIVKNKDSEGIGSIYNNKNVTAIYSGFENIGYNANEFNIGDIGNWNVSKVSDLGWCFDFAGANASTFYIGDLSNWNTSNVTKMVRMFASTGENANWSMDLSNWNVNKVIYYHEFNHYMN